MFEKSKILKIGKKWIAILVRMALIFGRPVNLKLCKSYNFIVPSIGFIEMKCGCVTGQYKYLWHDWVPDEVNDNGDDEAVYKSSRDFLALKNAIAPILTRIPQF